MLRPEYKSDVYYSVVIGADRFNGWKCIFAGDGSLVFQDEGGAQKKFYGGHGEGWLKRTRDEFTLSVSGAAP